MYPKCRNGCERDCSSTSNKVAGGNKANDFTVHLANLTVVFHETDERAKFSFVGVYPCTSSKFDDCFVLLIDKL